MNFLGHLYFSYDNLDLMHANLFGDFVKGSYQQKYAPQVCAGIRLHRMIDSYIGQHISVRQLSATLSTSLPKVSAVAIDIYFDHFLALHWSDFHKKNINEFLTEFYAHPIVSSDYPNSRFLTIIQHIKQEKWLSGNADLSTIDRICRSVSGRLSFPNALTKAGDVLRVHYRQIEEVFFAYMADAIPYFNTLPHEQTAK